MGEERDLEGKVNQGHRNPARRIRLCPEFAAIFEKIYCSVLGIEPNDHVFKQMAAVLNDEETARCLDISETGNCTDVFVNSSGRLRDRLNALAHEFRKGRGMPIPCNAEIEILPHGFVPERAPEQPTRKQVLDRDTVLELRPDLVKTLTSKRNKNCRASTIVTKMSGTKRLKEQAERYRNTRRWHYSDDNERRDTIDKWLEDNYPVKVAGPEPEEPSRIRLYDLFGKRRPGHFEGQSTWNKSKRKKNLAQLLVDTGVMKGKGAASTWDIDANDTEKIDEILATVDARYQRNGLRKKEMPAHSPTPRYKPPEVPAVEPGSVTYPEVTRPAANYEEPLDPAEKKRRAWAAAKDAREYLNSLHRGGKQAPPQSSSDLDEKAAKKAKVPGTVIGKVLKKKTLDSITELYAGHSSPEERKDLNTIFINFEPSKYERCVNNLDGRSLPSVHPAIFEWQSPYENGISYLLSQVKIKKRREKDNLLSPIERAERRRRRMTGNDEDAEWMRTHSKKGNI